MKIKKGVTRIVLIAFGYAFKIPNFKYCQLHFLQGCVGNSMERLLSKQWKPNINSDKMIFEFYSKINPTFFCSWFGLLAVQKEVEPLNFDIKELKYLQDEFQSVCTDFKTENFGLLKGKIVCIDYA